MCVKRFTVKMITYVSNLLGIFFAKWDISKTEVEYMKLDEMPGFRISWWYSWYTDPYVTPENLYSDFENKQFTLWVVSYTFLSPNPS